jgi:3-oxoacyl-[acyl-carrier-protein] synthase III
MSYSGQYSVGFVSAGMYLPEQIVTAADIALESGIEEWEIRDKFGITEKRMAGPEDNRRGWC